MNLSSKPHLYHKSFILTADMPLKDFAKMLTHFSEENPGADIEDVTMQNWGAGVMFQIGVDYSQDDLAGYYKVKAALDRDDAEGVG